MNGKGLVLVVDDTAESLILLSDLLRAEGYEVRPADSGELALAAAASIRPELILLDIRMPGLDGFEVCRRLKSQTQTRDIPIIFISAAAETQERLEGWRIGAVDYVSKPFERRELLARVAVRLELSRLQKELERRVEERTASLRAANEQLRNELEERRRAEQALRESEARFRNMADNACAMIWTSGPNRKIDFCNAYTLTFTGRQLEELTGEGWKDVIHPEDLELKYPAYAPLLEGHLPYQAEYRVRRADGEHRWMLDTATPRFLTGGGFAGYVGIAIDITDLRRNQERMLAAQKLESIGILVAGLAHRFNNLLGTIIAEGDLAASEIPLESTARDGVLRMNTAAMRASEIVALLMAYAGGGLTAHGHAVNLTDALEETLRLFKATAYKSIRFTANLPRTLPAIRADLSQVRQVVMNLLTNALEALPDEKGSIGLKASLTTIGIDGAPPSLPPGDYVRIEVRDTGRGIPVEARARIFDPFYTTKALGRGLGLAAVHGIIRHLGGAITLHSGDEQGSTFEVLLPVFRGTPDEY